MPYLFDGNNLGGVLWGREGARDRGRVLQWVLEWSRPDRKATVVFDGAADETLARDYGRIHLRFSGGRSADAVIRGLVREDPGRWIVVTDDRALRSHCRDHRARVVSPRELARDRASEDRDGGAAVKPEGPVDVDEWLDWFGEDDRK